MTENNQPIGLIAGEGQFSQACYLAIRQRHRVIVYFFADHRYGQWLDSVREKTKLSTARIGHGLRTIRRDGCRRLCTAGKVHRPAFWRLLAGCDSYAWRLWLAGGWSLGDDRLLRQLLAYAEKLGIQLVPPAAFGLDQPQHIATNHQPSAIDLEGVATGQALLGALSPFDTGQAAVIHRQWILGVEAAEGTAALLQRCQAISRKHKIRPVLVKLPKLGQLKGTDLPAIGVDTVEQAFQAHCAGIAIQSRHMVVIDHQQTVQHANRRGLFIIFCPTSTDTKPSY